MRRNVDLDEDLAAEVDRTAELLRQTPATIIRLAIRDGLPSVPNRFQVPQPEGYFADAYKDSTRAETEDAVANATIHWPER